MEVFREKTNANSIQYPNAVSMLPFPLVIPVTSHKKMISLTKNGRPSYTKDIIPAGISPLSLPNEAKES